MILLFMLYYIRSCQNNLDLLFEQVIFSGNDESDCFSDKLYTSTFISKAVFCFIRCTFNSIKSITNGGAIFIDQAFFDTNNIIHNCTFTQCSAKSGGAIYFEKLSNMNINQESRGNCSIEIINSNFYENSAYSNSGGSLYIFPATIKTNLKILNCAFNCNSAIKYGGSIFLQNIIYSIHNCTFNNNIIKSDSELIQGSAIFIEKGKSNEGIINCIFTNNIAKSNYSSSYGGALCILNDEKETILIDQCIFINNSVISSDDDSFGGAILFMNKKENYLLNECKFINNTSYSPNSSAFGGAISFLNNRETINITIIKCCFHNNKAFSLNGSSYGGALFSNNFLKELKDSEFNNNTSNSYNISKGGSIYIKIPNNSHEILFSQSCLFHNLIFVNNSVCSNSSSFGGSISYDAIKCSYMQQNFINCTFMNNKVFANYSSRGGAIESKSDMDGDFRNCTFTNNYVEVYLNRKFNYIDGGSLGGALFLEKSNIGILKCHFINNSCFGFSKNTYMYGFGGAIRIFSGKISIDKCKFENNSLNINGNGTTVSAHGGSCYLVNVWAYLIMCDFISNKAIVSELDNSCSISVGGAIYINSYVYPLLCRNCTFINNLSIDQSKQIFEYAGAIGVSNGEIYNCVFNDNAAYNGCDIYNDQLRGSKLSITNCSFNHKLVLNNHIYSLLYFAINIGYEEKVTFQNNKVLNYINAFLFDGKVLSKKGIININFQNNCVSPYNSSFLISSRFGDSKKFVSFNYAFNSACIENISNETSNVTTTQNMTVISNSEEPIITQIPSATKTIPVISKSDEQIITHFPTETNMHFDDQQKNTEKDNSYKLYMRIHVLAIAVLLLQVIIVFSLIALIILFFRRRNNNIF